MTRGEGVLVSALRFGDGADRRGDPAQLGVSAWGAEGASDHSFGLFSYFVFTVLSNEPEVRLCFESSTVAVCHPRWRGWCGSGIRVNVLTANIGQSPTPQRPSSSSLRSCAPSPPGSGRVAGGLAGYDHRPRREGTIFAKTVFWFNPHGAAQRVSH